MENNISRILFVLLLPFLPPLLSIPYSGDKPDVEIDPDMLNDIFGSALDSARYGAPEEEWEELPITLLPDQGDDDCDPIQQPNPEPHMMELHEEFRQIEVIKAEKGETCADYTASQGFECVPYYQCGEDGQIITDGYGLIDIRFGGEVAVLDSTDLMCPGSLDVCCKNPDFVAPTKAPIKSTTEAPTTPGGYGPDGDSSEEDSSEEDGYGGDGDGDGDGRDNSGEGDGDTGYGGGEEGEGKDNQKLTIQERCGRRNRFGLGVRIQNYKDGESQFGEWPHQCAILRKDTTAGAYGAVEEVKVFVGGSSLLYPDVALTAAHKITKYLDNPSQLVVRCGEWDTQTESEPLIHQDRQVKEIIPHPAYNSRNLANTAAVIILESEFELSQHIDVICLPDVGEVFDEESECFVKGWGKDKWEDGEYQVVMKQVSVPMVSNNQCLDWLRATRLGRRFRLDPSFVCAGGIAGEDACKGDGGGPLVCPTKQDPNRYVQVGIVAWGIECGEENVPGVYTSLSHLACWIEFTIQCRLPHKYGFRYGTECNPDDDPFLAKEMEANKDRCQVTWPIKEPLPSQTGKQIDGTDGYGTQPVQTLPEKIQKAAPGY